RIGRAHLPVVERSGPVGAVLGGERREREQGRQQRGRRDDGGSHGRITVAGRADPPTRSPPVGGDRPAAPPRPRVSSGTMTVSIGTIGTATSFGFGDRIGSATPGHVAALARSGGGITPILAQQSFREMARTGRTPRAVVRDAVAGAESAGFDGRIGADADHLKHADDVERAAEGGFVTFTIDPSDHVDPAADRDDAATLRRKVRALRDDLPWLDA